MKLPHQSSSHPVAAPALKAGCLPDAHVILAVVASLVVGLGTLNTSAAASRLPLSPAATGSPAIATPPLLVSLRKVERIHMADGIIESTQQASVAAQVNGVILDTRVDAGDKVVKGQLLATIDAREVQAGRDAARAQVAAAQSRVTEARQAWERTKSLRERNFVSQAALDQARAALDSADASLKATQSGEVLAGVQQGHARVVATQDGVIAARLAEAGELAVPGRPLFVIHQPGSLRVVASVPSSVQLGVAGPRVAEVVIPALGKSVVPGKILVLPAVDSRDLSRRIRVEIDAAAGLIPGLIPGMTAKVSLVLDSVERLVVPAATIVWRGDVAAVRVQSADGRPLLRQVRLGESYAGGWVEVLAGVTAGERLLPANIRE